MVELAYYVQSSRFNPALQEMFIIHLKHLRHLITHYTNKYYKRIKVHPLKTDRERDQAKRSHHLLPSMKGSNARSLRFIYLLDGVFSKGHR